MAPLAVRLLSPSAVRFAMPKSVTLGMNPNDETFDPEPDNFAVVLDRAPPPLAPPESGRIFERWPVVDELRTLDAMPLAKPLAVPAICSRMFAGFRSR